MAITINGTANTVAGLAVGGLPDGTTDADALASNAVTNVKVADDAIGVAELSATGTASSSTFLRGDNAWAVPGGGKILQVQNHTTSTQASTTSTSLQATGSTVNITPASASNKILVIMSGVCRTEKTGDSIGLYRIIRTVGGSDTNLKAFYFGANSVTHTTFSAVYAYLDSPNTTSEITYSIKQRCVNCATIYWSYANEASSIITMEVEA
jgi:hypothetical protein